MPERRRFASPKLLLRAYVAHQRTRERLRSMTEQADDEQAALDRDMADLLAYFPQGLRDGYAMFTDEGRPGSPLILVSPGPVEIYDVESWGEVEEWARRDDDAGDDDAPVGPGPDAPLFTVPANADFYPVEVSSLGHLDGVSVQDDDGDDF